MRILKKIAPFLAALSLSACAPEFVTKEYIEETIVEGSQVYTFFYDVRPRDWKIDKTIDGRTYLYADFENLNINKLVLDQGVVVASVLYAYNESGAQSWNNLPYVFPFTTKEGTVVGENIRFEYELKRLTFVIEDLDGYLPDPMSNPITFKVSIIVDKNR